MLGAWSFFRIVKRPSHADIALISMVVIPEKGLHVIYAPSGGPPHLK